MTFFAGTVVRTRSGLPVEIIAVLPTEKQAADGDCIVGLVFQRSGEREIATWQRDGRFTTRGATILDLEQPEIAAIAWSLAHV